MGVTMYVDPMSEDTPTTWKLDELARAAGVSVRTVRYYVQRGLLPLDAIQRELDRLDDARIGRIAEGLDLPEAPPPEPPAQVPAPSADPGERWRRVTLAPGLELWVSDQADEGVKARARRIAEETDHEGRRG